MEGWHPDGYPGNLAYSPELWEWMFELGLYLNFDPSHLLWLGHRPGRRAAARTWTASPTRTPRTPRPSREQRNRYGFFGRTATREQDPWDMGWWRYRIPGLGEVDFRRVRRRAPRGRLRRRPLGRARGPGLGRHAGEGRAGPADRARPPAADGGRDDRRSSRSAGSSRSTPASRRSQGVDLDVARGRGPLPARAQRRRQVDAHQVRLRRGRADRRRDPLRRRAAARRATRPARSRAASRRSTRSSTWSTT